MSSRLVKNYDSYGKIKFLQCNNQKRIDTCELIANMTDKMDSFVVIGQEPSSYGFNITGLNWRHVIIQGAVEKPRTYIYAHKDIHTWPIEQLCTKDVTACIIDTHNPGTGKALVVSVYWDGRIDNFPPEAIEGIKMARMNNYTLVLGGDLNARNILYGSNKTD